MNCELEAIPVADVNEVNFSDIDPKKNYRCRIQVGSRNAWRRYKGGYIEIKQPDKPGETQPTQIQHPAVYHTEPLTGETVQGLVMQHNQWLKANREKRIVMGTNSVNTRIRGKAKANNAVSEDGNPLYVGDVARQLLITHIEETDEPSEDRHAHRTQAELIRHAIAEVGKDLINAMNEASNTNTRSKRSSKGTDE